jgi:hypothetical protein
MTYPSRFEVSPGDRVTWIRSPGRSFLTGWRIQKIPGVFVRSCRQKIWIRVRLDGREKLVKVDPENILITADEK